MEPLDEPVDEVARSPHVLVVHPRIFDVIDTFQSQFELYQNNLRRAIYNLNDIMTDYAYNYADYQYYIIHIIQHLLQMEGPSSTSSSTSSSNGSPSYTPSTTTSIIDLITRGLQTSLNRDIPPIVQVGTATAELDDPNENEQSIYSSIMNMLTNQIRERFQNRATTREHLTNEQISIATRIIKYSNEFNEQRCPISLDEFVIDENICQIKQCSHIFKNNSLMVWLRSHRHCPVCRYDLSTYVEEVATCALPPTITRSNEHESKTEPKSESKSEPKSEPSWVEEDMNCDSIPFFNTISPPLPSSSPLPSSRIVDNIYNLVSSSVNTLSANQTNNPITQFLQSVIREHSNTSNSVTSIDERFPEQPDVD
jgi:hypothetical protein